MMRETKVHTPTNSDYVGYTPKEDSNMITTTDIIYKEVPGMKHGRRPCIVIAVTGTWAHIIPLSTSGREGQPYIVARGCEAKGYAANNRYHKVSTEGLEARGWVTEEDAGRAWDSVWG